MIMYSLIYFLLVLNIISGQDNIDIYKSAINLNDTSVETKYNTDSEVLLSDSEAQTNITENKQQLNTLQQSENGEIIYTTTNTNIEIIQNDKSTKKMEMAVTDKVMVTTVPTIITDKEDSGNKIERLMDSSNTTTIKEVNTILENVTMLINETNETEINPINEGTSAQRVNSSITITPEMTEKTKMQNSHEDQTTSTVVSITSNNETTTQTVKFNKTEGRNGSNILNANLIIILLTILTSVITQHIFKQ